MIHDLFRCALSHHAAAMHAGARADIHHVVGQTYGVLVVFDDDYRVAEVAQVGEGGQQALIVALVQADGGFVEDVHHADQAGTNLAGQADTLGFAAGQGVGATVQGQIVQADIDQELQALANFLEDFGGDLAASAGQAEFSKIVAGIADRQGGHRRQRFLANPDMSRFATQACAVAVRAGLGAEEACQLFAHAVGFGFPIAALQVGNDAFERVGAFDDIATVVQVLEVDILASAAEQDDFLMRSGQLVERLLQAETIVSGQ